MKGREVVASFLFTLINLTRSPALLPIHLHFLLNSPKIGLEVELKLKPELGLVTGNLMLRRLTKTFEQHQKWWWIHFVSKSKDE
jgi:hypothetical protein